ncbi:MAG: PTS fructose transporter subunit IIA [Deltaproteobacteria bacterium CG11_big_fil_rev_8_21_14_0_20_49_13]|nr:MAG: PTS fructose transporter subunit IIA [Deltaproteobacteria bacterium CG11_big_fil_rev_8_21_14_0_20_49_13]
MLENYLDISLIEPALKAATKEGILEEISSLVHKRYPSISKETIDTALLEREHIDSTGIEKGIAIPHAKIEGMERLAISISIARDGIDFNSHDKALTFLFFTLLAPKNEVVDHIKVLARLAKLLRDESLRKKLTGARTAEEIYNTMIEADKRSC